MFHGIWKWNHQRRRLGTVCAERCGIRQMSPRRIRCKSNNSVKTICNEILSQRTVGWWGNCPRRKGCANFWNRSGVPQRQGNTGTINSSLQYLNPRKGNLPMCAQKLSFDYAHTLHTVRIVHNAHSVHRSRVQKGKSCDCINFVRATDDRWNTGNVPCYL